MGNRCIGPVLWYLLMIVRVLPVAYLHHLPGREHGFPEHVHLRKLLIFPGSYFSLADAVCDEERQ